MNTLEQVLKEGRTCLENVGIAEADLDAWYLLEYQCSINRGQYFMNPQKEVSQKDYETYMDLIAKRATRVPLQHITNSREFYGYEFYVNEHVLIPRQETEILVEAVLPYAKDKNVLDICTGSGCIIISIAKSTKVNNAVAVDISEKALEVAKKNSYRLNTDVVFLQGDLFEPIEGKFDLIVSNPPYITTDEINTLEPEVRLHEPMLALDGHEDGLYFYRKLINQASDYLNPGGRIFFEIGYDQGEAVKQLLLAAGFNEVSVMHDLTNKDRVVSGLWIGR